MDKRSRQAVHALITIAAAATALYVGLALWLYASQARLVYLPNLPSRALTATPADIGLDYETVHLSTADGIQLYAWYVPAPAPRATILFFHGNAGNISQRLDTLRIMHQLELSVLIVDYRGYGRSTGRPSEHGTYLDAEAAWHYLTAVRGIAPEHIVIWGRSLGAAVGAHLAAQQTPNALVMESAFISVPALGAELYPWLPVRWLTRLHYDNVATLARVSCPVLIVHSREDEIIPFAHGQTLFAHARPPKQFLELRGGHNDGFLLSERPYIQGVSAFLAANEPTQGVTPSRP